MRPPPVFNSRSPRQCLPAIDLGRILYFPSFSDLIDRVQAHPPSAYNIVALYVGPPTKSPPQQTFHLVPARKNTTPPSLPKKAPGTLPPSGSTHPGTRADKYPPTQSPAPGSEEQPPYHRTHPIASTHRQKQRSILPRASPSSSTTNLSPWRETRPRIGTIPTSGNAARTRTLLLGCGMIRPRSGRLTNLGRWGAMRPAWGRMAPKRKRIKSAGRNRWTCQGWPSAMCDLPRDSGPGTGIVLRHGDG